MKKVKCFYVFFAIVIFLLHQSGIAKKELKADFDLSKGKLLTNEQYDKFFNIQLTKQQPVKQEQKKKRPYSLDYRCVNDMFL